MRLPRNSNLVNLSRILRNNSTGAERKLWFEFLRTYLPHWYRQKIVSNFILDFYCPQVRLAIELDGGQHYEDENAEQDRQRTLLLKTFGVRTIRFTNLDVINNFDQVCLTIDDEVKDTLSNV